MKRAGFTLVEVLISLMIFAMLAAAGAAVLGVAIDNRFAIKEASDRIADLQRTRSLLRADIGQASARRTRGPTGRPEPRPMMGRTSQGGPVLVLTRSGWSNPQAKARPSLQRVEYRVVEDRLERRVSSHLDGSAPGAPQVLYRGVSAVAVTFLNDGGEAPAYINTIDRPLPDAVRIVMTLQGYGPVDQLFLVGGG